MQVYKTTTVKAAEADFGEPAQPLSPEEESALAEDAAGFFTPPENAAEAEAPPVPTNPFDLLFSNAVAQAAAQASAASDPASQNFSAEKIPTLQDWLMMHPEGRFFLDKFILKMESARDNSLVRMKQELETKVGAGGLSPSDIIATQKKIGELNAAILKINQEIQKAQAMMGTNQETFEQEKVHMKDLNGDGYVGDPADKKNSFIVGHHPNGKEVLLNAETKKPALNPYLDPEYAPAVANLETLTLLNKAAQETVDEYGTVHPKEGKLAADVYLQIKNPNQEGCPAIEFAAQEGFWVRKDKNGKTKFDKDGSYVVKEFEIITREDGTEMVGQKPPAENEKEKWTFVKATDLRIYSEPTTHKADGGDVYADFKDDQGRMIARLRVQGIGTAEELRTSSGQHNDGRFYTAATTMGVVVNSGYGAHSSRVSPMNVDASGLESTGVVNDSLHPLGGYAPTTLIEVLNNAQSADRIINDDLLLERLRQMNTSYIDTEGDALTNSLKMGITITGLRGTITGTNYNDVIVVSPPNDEKIRDLLPLGAEEIQPHHGGYATYVDGQKGDNIIVSKGGDLFAKGVNYLWRESEAGETDNQIWIETNNRYLDSDMGGGHHHIDAVPIEVHIKDTAPAIVKIHNGQDGNDENGEQDLKGTNDDIYDVPSNTKFSMMQNDLPGGFDDRMIEAELASQIATALSEGFEKIRKEAINADPLAEVEGAEAIEWEFGAAYDEWDKQSESFFGEWDFFKDGTESELDTDLGADPEDAIDEDVEL